MFDFKNLDPMVLWKASLDPVTKLILKYFSDA